MDKLLFIARNDILTGTSSVGKKVYRQYRALSEYFDTYLISQTETKIILTHNGKSEVIEDVKKRNRMLKRISEYTVTIAYSKGCKYIYIRYPKSNPIFIGVLKQLKRINCRIIIEYPTYPYDAEIKTYGKTIRSKCIFYVDRICRNVLKKYVYAAATFSEDEEIFGTQTFQVYNGIFVNDIKPRIPRTDGNVHVIAVAEMQQSHGYDRLIEGIRIFYSKPQKTYVYLHLIGEGPEKIKYENMVKGYHLEKYIFFYGYCIGDKLNQLYDMGTIAAETLGLHRVGIALSSSLKSREYLSKGLPIITSVNIDVIPRDYPYILRVESNDNAIDIDNLVKFHNKVYEKGIGVVSNEIRHFAEEHCDMVRAMQVVKEKFYE